MEITLVKDKIDGWLRNKTSPHFDVPLKFFTNDFPKKKIATKVVKNLYKFFNDPTKVSHNSFYPFIGYDIIERRRSRLNQGSSIEKIRPIRYAGHFDSYIYSYYAYKLSEVYEKKILELDLDKVVSAYRKTREGMTSKNNVLMAKEVFDEINKRDKNCIALAFDIKGFYDHIDHKKLKQEWENLLNPDGNPDYRLPKDVFKIYESLTRYSYVDAKDLCLYFRTTKDPKSCWCQMCLPKKEFTSQKLSKPILKTSEYYKLKQWYKKNYGEIFRRNEGLKDKDNPYGIPQGSPMSSLLSNLYMIPFDLKMKKLADELGGVYRRYCDDIIFICQKYERDLVEKEIKCAIKERGNNLIIHEINDSDPHSKSQCYDFTSEKVKRKPLKYLGFSFDGESVAIREESLAKYLRRSKKGIVAARKGAEINLRERYKKGMALEDKHKKLFKKRIFTNYTHLGKRNFIFYAYNSFKEMDDRKIKEQVAQHFKRIEKLLKGENFKLKIFIKNEEYKKVKTLS